MTPEAGGGRRRSCRSDKMPGFTEGDGLARRKLMPGSVRRLIGQKEWAVLRTVKHCSAVTRWLWLSLSHRRVLLTALVAAGLAVRAWNLQAPFLFRDEAESAINALTILEHGVPSDSYLGLPIYENILIRPWPESQEYEFRDISYSDRGVAIYHGWLPLYTVAGSLAAFGIVPDEKTPDLQVRSRWRDELHRRTIAPRVPSVIFGGVFILAAFFAGGVLYGRDAGWIAAVTAAFGESAIGVARQARYHSAALALTTLCIALLWLMLRDGRWRYHLLAALLFTLLFHTHVLAFVAACAAWLTLLPWILKRPNAVRKSVVFCGIIGVGVLPWMVLTGFIDAVGNGIRWHDVPSAATLMSFPSDWLSILEGHLQVAALFAVAPFAVGGAILFRDALNQRIARPLIESAPAVLFLCGWLAIGFLASILLIPASSAFGSRVTHGLQGPALVLMSILAASAARMILPSSTGSTEEKRLTAVAIVALLVMLVTSGQAIRNTITRSLSPGDPLVEVIEYLQQQKLTPDTRIYALPYFQLPMMYYSGLPVQNVAPVRRSFLDSYPGRVLILETVPRAQSVGMDRVRSAAEDAGVELSREELEEWQRLLSTGPMREDLARRGADPHPPLDALPHHFNDLAARIREVAALAARQLKAGVSANPAWLRGYEVSSWEDFWPNFFYRFVGPSGRAGANLNYAARIQGSRAVVLRSSWVVFDCPPLGKGLKTPVSKPRVGS